MKDINEIKLKYLEIFPDDGLIEKEIEIIEESLKVNLPNDFRIISQFFSGGNLGIIDFFDFKRNNPLNIIDETIRLRETLHLPNQFIILAEPSESIVILDLYKRPSIIWCDAVEINKINERDFDNPPDVWECFSDLFYDMLMEEIE